MTTQLQSPSNGCLDGDCSCVVIVTEEVSMRVSFVPIIILVFGCLVRNTSGMKQFVVSDLLQISAIVTVIIENMNLMVCGWHIIWSLGKFLSFAIYNKTIVISYIVDRCC